MSYVAMEDHEHAAYSMFCDEMLSTVTVEMFDVQDNKRKHDELEEVLEEHAVEEQAVEGKRKRRITGRRGVRNTSAPMEAEARLFAAPPNMLDILIRGCVTTFGQEWVPLERVRALAAVIGYSPRSGIFRESWIMRTSRYGRNSEKRTTSEPFGHYFPYWDVSDSGKMVKLAPEFFAKTWSKPVVYDGPPVPAAADAASIVVGLKQKAKREQVAKAIQMRAGTKKQPETVVPVAQDFTNFWDLVMSSSLATHGASTHGASQTEDDADDYEIATVLSNMVEKKMDHEDLARFLCETPAVVWEELEKEQQQHTFQPIMYTV